MRQAGFDHLKHARLFPTCASCHQGAAATGRPIWPDPATCAACHDGTIQPRVDWRPPAAPRRTNLRFSHATHATHASPAGPRRGEEATSTSCHAMAGTPAMAVRPAVVENCFACHGIRTAHLAAPDAECATCHLPLAQATTLTREDVAHLPAPPSHEAKDFATAHGATAKASNVSCATCHARDFCSSCHVNAPEQPAIASLAADPRSLAIKATLATPASHDAPGFLERHGVSARKAPQQCATCHTRESCTTCHTGNTRVLAALPAAGPGRGVGARLTRVAPASHTPGFRDRHAATAEAAPSSCTTCHARSQCLECHRPSAAAASRAYHPAGFLTRHPASAYSRETSCADCHNTQVFCVSCHQKAGFATRAPLGAGYHDAKRSFLLGHGPAE